MFFNFNRFTKGSFNQSNKKFPVKTKATYSNLYGQNYNLNRFNTNTDDLTSDSVLEQWLPKTPEMLHKLFRIIHKFDSVAGPAVDLISIMPFSDITLTGISDKKILDIYEQSIEELHIDTLMPDIASEYLVIGRVIASLLFDESRGIWTDIIIQNPDFCNIVNIPLVGYAPKVDLKVSKEFKDFLLSKDPRDTEALKEIPENFRKELLLKDYIPLDPASTLYLPRQTTPYDFMGSSIYYRIIQFFALEKSLVNGTLIAAKRRQRSILHVTVGESDLWEPDEEDISAIAGMFMQADEDPQGAIVATRMGVDTNEVRSGQDFWKLSDEWDFLSNAKMRALGINESFLCVTGDTLIPTAKGILRIDELGGDGSKDIEDISINIASIDNKQGQAIKLIYRGETDIIHKTVTKSGRLLKTTEDHKILVLENNKLEWKKAKYLRLGDKLCIPTKKINNYNNSNLLKIDTDLCIKTGYINPSVSFFIGLLVSSISLLTYRDTVYKFNNYLLNIYIDTLAKVFGENDVFVNDLKYLLNNNLLDNFIKLFINNSKEEVPRYILQADKESQIAYLAAYLVNYGNIDENGIEYYSTSKENLRQIQCILNIHGVLSSIDNSKLYIDKYFLNIFYNYIYKYIFNILDKDIINKINYDYNNSNNSLNLPIDIKSFIMSRKLYYYNEGTYYLNDFNEKVFIKSLNINSLDKYLSYNLYKKGFYNKLLEDIKIISEEYYSDLVYLLDLEYFYDEVVSLNKIFGNKKVYDLTMSSKDKPAFIGNGIVIHNSGDATYNTLEAALSVFIETLRNFRSNLTSRIFYEKLFPTLAKIHGFKKRSQAELSHGIRINGSNSLNSDLIMPQIEYHKQLRPEADSMYLDILSTMEEKGIPIPLRTWSTAGGLSFDRLLEMKDEDIKDRKDVSNWLKITKAEESEGSAWGSLNYSKKNNSVSDDLKKKAIASSLSTLPIWDKDKFFDIEKKVFIDILSSNSPVNKLKTKFKKYPKKLDASNYILHRMGIKDIPFNISFVKYLAKYLKSCIGNKYSGKEINKEFIALNSIIRNSKGLTNKKDNISFDEKKLNFNIYSGYNHK